MGNSYFKYHIHLLLATPEISTDLLWNLTGLFIILAIIYLISVFYFKFKTSSKTASVKQRKNQLSPAICEFLFYEADASADEMANYIQLKVEIRELIKDDFNRKVLSEVLLDLRKDVSGKTQKRLFKLYQDLGLHKDAYERLRSWKWHVVSKGISELTKMRVEESYGSIVGFLNDRRATIRKQAEIAVVTLKHEGINNFLDTTKYKISEWQQLKLLDVIRNFEDYQPPSFKAWLTSSNRHVVLFSLRLIKYYGQSDSKLALVELTKHKNNQIKSEAINCIKEFHVTEATETLKTIFWKSSSDIKILILDAVANFADEKDIEFLKLIEHKESNFTVRNKALCAINAVRPDSILPTEGIVDISGYRVPEDVVPSLKGVDDVYTDDTMRDAPLEPYEEFVPRKTEKLEKQNEAPVNRVEEVENYTIDSNTGEMDQKEFPAKDSYDNELIEFTIDSLEVLESEELEDSLKPWEVDKQIADPEYDNIDLGFLPHVVSSETEHGSNNVDEGEIIRSYKTTSKYRFSKIAETCDKISEIDVIAQFVGSSDTTEKNLDEIDSTSIGLGDNDGIDDSVNLDFLPIVLENKQIPGLEKVTASERLEIAELPVIYEEIKLDIDEPVIDQPVADLEELTPLPSKSKSNENKTKRNVSTEQILKPSSINHIDMKRVKKIDCEGVEIKPESQQAITEKKPVIENEQQVREEVEDSKSQDGKNALDWIMDENEAQGELAQKLKDIVNSQELTTYNIPKPIFPDKSESNLIELLDDIEALGDEREVPLLKDLLEDDDTSTLHDRIQYLIEKISGTTVLKREPRVPSKEQFSIFEIYFRTMDAESKIILLDEIVAVGDEKEMGFLKKLSVDDSDPRVQQKARKCFEKLSVKLSLNIEEQNSVIDQDGHYGSADNTKPAHAATEEIKEDKPFSVFDIDFVLTPLEGQGSTKELR